MIIIPYNHDKMQFHRLPFVTIGLILINIFIFLITCLVISQSRDAINGRADAMVQYYLEHPYLEIPEETILKVAPEWQAEIQAEKSIADIMGADIMGEKPVDEEQEHLDILVKEFENAVSGQFYRKYGYIPAVGGVFSMISSMFLHGGFLHLVFNMLFLWLAGGVIEDLWGRAVFPVFYIVGGMIAALAHASAYPASHQPLIGASGAIAALMGAFMICRYKARIKFIYAIFIGFRLRYGAFNAPAYIILPIWFLQQIGDFYLYSSTSDVAFLSHIGGFAFGAMFAVILKISHIEKIIITPMVEKKLELLDENLSQGEEDLLNGKIEEAAHKLRLAITKNPKDPMAHSHLCKAYFHQYKKRVALMEMNRAITLYFESGYIDNATDFYLEITNEFDDAVLEPGLQFKIASIFRDKEQYSQAADAYYKLSLHYLPDAGTPEHPEAINALMMHGDLCYQYLAQPDDACSSYKKLLEYKACLSKEQIDDVKEKIQLAKTPTADHIDTASPSITKAIKNSQFDNLNKKIKIADHITTPPIYDVPSLIPVNTGNVDYAENGLYIRMLNHKTICFSDINYLCIFQIAEQPDILYADIFSYEESRPYRILSSQVTYRQFLSELEPVQLNNFHRFMHYVISQMDSVFIDEKTLTYIKTKKPPKYATQDHVKQLEKKIWMRLKGKRRISCSNCHETFWFDGKKIPKTGAKTTCKKCGYTIKIKNLIAKTQDGPDLRNTVIEN